MLKKFKNLDPQTKLFIKATTIIATINVIGLVVVKVLDMTENTES